MVFSDPFFFGGGGCGVSWILGARYWSDLSDTDYDAAPFSGVLSAKFCQAGKQCPADLVATFTFPNNLQVDSASVAADSTPELLPNGLTPEPMTTLPLYDQSGWSASAIVPPLGSTAGDGTNIAITIPGILPVVDLPGLLAWQASTSVIAQPVDAVTVRVAAPGKPAFVFRGYLDPGPDSTTVRVRVAPMPVKGVYQVSLSVNGAQFFPPDPDGVTLVDDGRSVEFFDPFILQAASLSGPEAGGVNASSLTRLEIRAPNFPDSLTFDEYVCCRFLPARSDPGAIAGGPINTTVCFGNTQYGRAEFIPKSQGSGAAHVNCYPPPLPVSTGHGEDSEYVVFVALNGQDFGDTGTLRYQSTVTYRSIACPQGQFAASPAQYVVCSAIHIAPASLTFPESWWTAFGLHFPGTAHHACRGARTPAVQAQCLSLYHTVGAACV